MITVHWWQTKWVRCPVPWAATCSPQPCTNASRLFTQRTRLLFFPLSPPALFLHLPGRLPGVFPNPPILVWQAIKNSRHCRCSTMSKAPSIFLLPLHYISEIITFFYRLGTDCLHQEQLRSRSNSMHRRPCWPVPRIQLSAGSSTRISACLYRWNPRFVCWATWVHPRRKTSIRLHLPNESSEVHVVNTIATTLPCASLSGTCPNVPSYD